MNKLLIIVLIVILLVVGGWAAYSLGKSNSDNLNGNTANNQTQSKTDSDTTPAADSTQTAADGKVSMQNMMFTPSQISVSVGSTVTWTNNDSVAHTVTDDLSNVGGPASGSVAPGATYSFTFTKAGSYQYHCNFHTSMRGTIVVK